MIYLLFGNYKLFNFFYFFVTSNFFRVDASNYPYDETVCEIIMVDKQFGRDFIFAESNVNLHKGMFAFSSRFKSSFR